MVKSKSSMTASRSRGIGEKGFFDFVDRHTEYGRFVYYDQYQDFRANGLNGKTALQLFIDEHGLYGKPTLMSDAEFDAYAAEHGLDVMYRGMPNSNRTTGAEKHLNYLVDDRYFVGTGIYGDGMYFGKEDVARYYADGYGTGGSIIKAALKPGTRIIDYSDVKAMFRKAMPDAPASEYDGLFSSYAMSLGYDAITVDQGSHTFYIVLNRSALVASEMITNI